MFLKRTFFRSDCVGGTFCSGGGGGCAVSWPPPLPPPMLLDEFFFERNWSFEIAMKFWWLFVRVLENFWMWFASSRSWLLGRNFCSTFPW